MFLSFIVPVYNAEKYICECLNSLLEQDIPKEDYEIICVNDGSVDTSLEILEAYAVSYPNIVVISKENGGVTTARNAGLTAARGDYIWFVDSDDMICENILGQLRSKAAETGCDRLIVGGYQFLDVLSPEESESSRQKMLPINCPWYDAVVWRSLIRRGFLLEHNLFFCYPELTHGEDGLFMYEVGLYAPKNAEISEALYFYREHSGSAETAVSPENRGRKLRSYTRITQILQEHYVSGRTNAATANKLMTFLWFALYETAKLPVGDSRNALDTLKQAGLFPYRRLPECTLTCSYMTDTSSLPGKLLDKLYCNLHTRWGYSLFRLLQLLIQFKNNIGR